MHLVSSGLLSLSACGWASDTRRLTISSRTLFRASCLRFSSALRCSSTSCLRLSSAWVDYGQFDTLNSSTTYSRVT